MWYDKGAREGEKNTKKSPDGRRNISVQTVVARPFVPMEDGSIVARIVMVKGCARMHTVQPEKASVSSNDIVFFLFVHFFPAEQVARDYRTNDTTVVAFLQETFRNVDWRWEYDGRRWVLYEKA